MDGFVDVGPADRVAPGEAAAFEVDGRRIAVFNVGGELYAMDDLCTHDEASLSEGNFNPETKTVRCPRHSSHFDVTTGRPKSLPAIRPVRTYPAKIEGGRITIALEN